MLNEVMCQRGDDLNVLRSVVTLDAVLVVRDFAGVQRSAKNLLGDKSMFVNVAAHVGKVVVWHPQEDITV